jgi:hypothetical protein
MIKNSLLHRIAEYCAAHALTLDGMADEARNACSTAAEVQTVAAEYLHERTDLNAAQQYLLCQIIASTDAEQINAMWAATGLTY